jgi:protein-disulfide isomerase-like protein with CxxC motif
MAKDGEAIQPVRLLLDPACPWAYRAALWMQEVAKVRPLAVRWELYALEFVNRDKKEDSYLRILRRGRRALRLIAGARRVAGDEAMERLYLLIGEARHEHRRALNDEKMLSQAVEQAGLPLSLLEETRADPQLDAELEGHYVRAERQGAFGVPTLFIGDNGRPFYGPVLDSVPSGEEAGEVWDHVSALARLPYFFELKRNRV